MRAVAGLNIVHGLASDVSQGLNVADPPGLQHQAYLQVCFRHGRCLIHSHVIAAARNMYGDVPS
jgi:hypothetical protein